MAQSRFIRLLTRFGSTPQRVLVISCHPSAEGLIPAARQRILGSLDSCDVDVRHTDLYSDGFKPELTAEEHRHHTDPIVSDDLMRYTRDLTWCDTLVLVYPTWWSTQPAMLKGWIDRVWAAGVAWELPNGADRLVPRLHNVRRIIVVTSHGSNKWINSFQGEGGKRVAFRSLRSMCNRRTRCHWWALYGVDTSSEETRRAWLEQLDERTIGLFG